MTDLIKHEERYDTKEVVKQSIAIQELMADIMKENIHYGIIPGCGDKPTLSKAGAEKILQLFKLGCRIEGERNPIDLGNGHREYVIKVTVFHIPTGNIVGEGIGSATTKEDKWRYRKRLTFISNDIPKDYNINKGIYKSEGYVARLVDNKWGWYKEEKIEIEPANNYNTVLKMAFKRAYVAATITCTAASDIYNQDLEDLDNLINNEIENIDIENETNYDSQEMTNVHKISQNTTNKEDETYKAIEELKNTNAKWNNKFYGNTIYINGKKYHINKEIFLSEYKKLEEEDE